MKKLVFTILGLALSLSFLSAQNQDDPIQVKKKLGTVFMQNGQVLAPRHLLEITKNTPEAYALMEQAKPNHAFSSIFGFAGGFLIGWPIGGAIAGGDPNWALAGIGAGLIVVSIPFTSAYNKHAKEAARLYNSGLNNSSSSRKVDLSLQVSGNSIGLKLQF